MKAIKNEKNEKNEEIDKRFNTLNIGCKLLNKFKYLTLKDVIEFSKCLVWSTEEWYAIIPLISTKESEFVYTVYKYILNTLLENNYVQTISYLNYEYLCVQLWSNSPNPSQIKYNSDEDLIKIFKVNERNTRLFPMTWFDTKTRRDKNKTKTYIYYSEKCIYCETKDECFLKDCNLGTCSSKFKSKKYCNSYAGLHFCRTHGNMVLKESYDTFTLEMLFTLKDGRSCPNLSNFKRLCKRYKNYIVTQQKKAKVYDVIENVKQYLTDENKEEEEEEEEQELLNITTI